MNEEDFIKRIRSQSVINGEGWVEKNAEINGELTGYFFVGAYSYISSNSKCDNLFIGRFSTVQDGVVIGTPKHKNGTFSTHSFVRGTNKNYFDNYLKSITSRYYYETEQITFIGNDVFVGNNVIIEEGCSIGDGAIVYPNSFINSDVPDYAIMAGSPAVIIGYRFSEEIRYRLKKSEWWKKDFSGFISSKNKKYNYVNNIDILDFLENSDELLPITRYYINTVKSIYKENNINRLITGPSHIDIWRKKILYENLRAPENFHLIPIAAVSLFSSQLNSLINWWIEWFDEVLLFVPDFRIGNISIYSDKSDGRFISSDHMSAEVSLECYQRGIRQLDIFAKTKKVMFWFWSLYGREAFNIKKGKFMSDGEYKHPIWNYTDVYRKYKEYTLNVSDFFSHDEIIKNIVDMSIHPTDECYLNFNSIFEASFKN